MKPSFSSDASTPRSPAPSSISAPPGAKSPAAWLASLPQPQRDAFLAELSRNATLALPWLFDFWARADHQLPPEGDWTTWVVLGGRGSGKTRAGAEWVRAQVEGPTAAAPGAARRVALVAETWEQAREVMVMGESGLIACTPPDRRPTFNASRRLLSWPNGAEARLYSAADPESLRGPQFDAAWCDELAKWRSGEAAWTNLQFCLRLGERPRQVVTTTPRNVALLREILGDAGTVTTSAPTAANSANLPAAFIAAVTRRYAGTARGREELDGALLVEAPGAMFTRGRIDAARVTVAPALDRVVVGVDPAVTAGAGADACGIVVAGRAGEAFYVLEDATLRGVSPDVWARRAIEAARRWEASHIVAEVNQGGDLVLDVLRRADPHAPVRSVRASRGKAARAEPASLLYERGLVRHVGVHAALEDELCAFGEAGGSPDRVDALVWALTALTQAPGEGPRVRVL